MRSAPRRANLAVGLAAVLALGVVGRPLPVLASEPKVPIEEEWQYSELELLEAGFKIDADSLIELATSHEDPLIRWKAVFVLGGRRERSAVPALRAILANPGRDPGREVSRQAARALIRLGEPDGLDALRGLLASPDASPFERMWIAEDLAKMGGDPAGFTYLEKMLESDSPVIRRSVAAPLVAFIGPFLAGDLAADPCALLIGLARDEAATVRRYALAVFHQAVTAGCKAAAFESEAEVLAAGDVDSEVRDKAAEALTRLQKLAEGQGPVDRKEEP